MKPATTQLSKMSALRRALMWQEIQHEYTGGKLSLRAIAEKHNLSLNTLFKRSLRERWHDERLKLEERRIATPAPPPLPPAATTKRDSKDRKRPLTVEERWGSDPTQWPSALQPAPILAVLWDAPTDTKGTPATASEAPK